MFKSSKLFTFPTKLDLYLVTVFSMYGLHALLLGLLKHHKHLLHDWLRLKQFEFVGQVFKPRSYSYYLGKVDTAVIFQGCRPSLT